MKKKLILGLFCIVSLLLITGCNIAVTKQAVSVEDFTKLAEEKDLIVVDVKEQFAEYDFITTATVAANPTDGWQVEHYVLTNSEEAKNMFNKNKTDFETLNTSGSKNTNIEVGNYNKYTLETDTYYCVITRVDNTFLYAKVTKENKDAALELINELGY